MVKNLRQVDTAWTPEILKLWRAARNAALGRMAECFGLTPTQLSRVRYGQLFYGDGGPARTTIAFFVQGGRPKTPDDMQCQLPAKLRLDLAAMHCRPKLFYDYQHIRPLFTPAGEERPLSAGHIRRIIKQEQKRKKTARRRYLTSG